MSEFHEWLNGDEQMGRGAPPAPTITDEQVDRAFREMVDVQRMADLHVDDFKSYLRAALEAALLP